MKRQLSLFTLVVALGSWNAARAQSSEITLIAPGGIRAALEQLIAGFEKTTGTRVKATFGSGLGTKRQVALGEAFDVAVIQPPYEPVLASGNLVANTATPLATVAVGMAVRKGAPRPNISSPETVKSVLLAAKSIAYPDPAGGAAAGISFDDSLRRLGIAAQVEQKLRRAAGGAGAMAMTARGEVEIGLTFLSEMEDSGIDVVGSLPAAISTPTALTGFVSTRAKDPRGAKTLLEYLASEGSAAVYRKTGMQPGR